MKRPPVNLNAAVKSARHHLAWSPSRLRSRKPLEVHGIVPPLAGARRRWGQQTCRGGAA